MAIEYITGDATRPVGVGTAIIAHVCNDIGKWGRGFVLAVSARWEEPERRYVAWSKMPEFGLGRVQLVQLDRGLYVANMVAQKGIHPDKGVPPIRYESLRKCLCTLGMHARSMQASVHMPRIGSGLAGGDWLKIEPIILQELTKLNVFIYDFVDEQSPSYVPPRIQRPSV